MAKKLHLYGKLDVEGIPTKTMPSEKDYETAIKFIKETFPNKQIQKSLPDALKRVFVLRSAGHLKSFHTPQKTKSSQNAQKKLQQRKAVPKRMQYEQFLKLNNLWNEYIADLLKWENKEADISQKLNRVDYHGALVKVTASSSEAITSIEGIILKETKNTFVIVTPKNLRKVIPKRNTAFEISLNHPKGSIALCGNSLLCRPGDRASKKIKSFMEFVGLKKYKSMLKY